MSSIIEQNYAFLQKKIKSYIQRYFALFDMDVKSDLDDITHDIIVKILPKIEFNETVCLQTIHNAFSCHLATICKRYIIDNYFRKKTTTTLTAEQEYIIEGKQPDPETAKFIEKAYDLLSDKQKQIFVLYLEGATATEIAKILDIPRGTVKSRWNTITTKLREHLGV